MENIDLSQIAFEWVKDICDKFGPRPATSKAERAAAEYFKKQLEDFGDEILFDEFFAIPKLYPTGLTKQAITWVLIGIPFFFLSFPWTLGAFLFPLFGLFVFFVSLFLMKEWFGFFYKKGKSQNVFTKIYPKPSEGEKAKNPIRIVIGGHMDSAIEFKIQKYGDLMAKLTGIAFFYIILVFIGSIVKIILELTIYDSISLFKWGILDFTIVDLIFALISLFGLPFLIFILRGYTGNTRVLGANDNLMGVGIAYALGKYFSMPEHRLRNVELWVGGFGSEECGERGSHAFVKKYGPLGYLDRAYAIIPESCGAGTHLAIVTEEKMHFAKHDINTCQKLFRGYIRFKQKALENGMDPNEIPPCDVKVLPMAASDAGRFSHAGYKATMLLGYEGHIMKPKNWHSIHDTPENLQMNMIRASLETIREFILMVEEEEN